MSANDIANSPQDALPKSSPVLPRLNFPLANNGSSPNMLRSPSAPLSQSSSSANVSPVSKRSPQSTHSVKTGASHKPGDFDAMKAIDSIKPIETFQLENLLRRDPHKLLVIDVRPFTTFAAGHIKDAVSICVPSTLLKRSTFDFHHILDFVGSRDAEALRRLSTYDHIALYDGGTASLRVRGGLESPLLRTAIKFLTSSELKGQVSFVVGGMARIEEHVSEDLIESYEDDDSFGTNSFAANEPKSPFNLMPVRTSRYTPPLGIPSRGLSPLSAGSYIDDNCRVEIPSHVASRIDELPLWLQSIANQSSQGENILADMFREIEQGEQRRIQGAFSTPSPISKHTSPSSSSRRARLSTPTRESSPGSEYAFCAGNDPQKNRYVNICPYSHNRVRLGNRGPGHDYINASYVSVKDVPLRYIATQAPLPTSFSDFWHCVWDNKVPLIIMLTALTSESGVIKSHNYWKDGHYGEYTLKQTAERAVMPGFIVREFSLYLLGQEKPHTVTQLHYEKWPDLGCPTDSLELLHIVELKRSLMQNAPSDSHVMVHCSAGCGRTGTLIAVDTVLHRLDNNWTRSLEEEQDPIFNTVKELREQRLAMVQTVRQLRLCYTAILEWMYTKINSPGTATVA